MSVAMRKFRALDRRRKAVALYAAGRSQQEIAETLGVDRATVSRDLTLMREEWKKNVQRNYQELCDRELLRLQLLEREAWDNWDWENAPVTASGEKRQGSKSRWKYLEVIVRCSAQRRRLLALDGPDREPQSSRTQSPEVQLAEQERGQDEIEELLSALREMEAAERMDNGQLIMDNEVGLVADAASVGERSRLRGQRESIVPSERNGQIVRDDGSVGTPNTSSVCRPVATEERGRGGVAELEVGESGSVRRPATAEELGGGRRPTVEGGGSVGRPVTTAVGSVGRMATTSLGRPVTTGFEEWFRQQTDHDRWW